MKLIQIKHLIWLVLIPFGLIKCGQRGTLTGGPKDSIPPVLINANPKLNTTQFDKDEIRLTFDEFVTLKSVNSQLVVSPPLETGSYTVYPRTGASKRVVIEIQDTLTPNTTYTFNFGESIADNNEGNVLPLFTYVLSTGDFIDSLSLSGRVVDAIDLDPVSNLNLQLYPVDSTFSDSTIFNQRPLYIANTLDTIVYQFQNLKEGKYHLIALDDASGNYLFDQNADKIGFLDRNIELPRDSVVDLRIFQEIPNFSWVSPQYINSNLIYLGYYGEYTGQKMEMISQVPESFESIITKPNATDTLFYWFKGAELDSLKFRYPQKDTILTRNVRFIETIEDSLVIEKITGSTLHLGNKFEIGASRPIVKIDTSKVAIKDVDTVPVSFDMQIAENKHSVLLDFEIAPNDNYTLELHSGAIEDFFGSVNDSIVFNSRTISTEDYGTINVTVINDFKSSYILELINSRGEIQRTFEKVAEDDSYTIEYLLPGTYFLRVIKDLNQNGKWDTGNYLQKIQPEEVVYYPDTLELRANWEFNEIFNVGQINLRSQENATDEERN